MEARTFGIKFVKFIRFIKFIKLRVSFGQDFINLKDFMDFINVMDFKDNCLSLSKIQVI